LRNVNSGFVLCGNQRFRWANITSSIADCI
jgi:hypothetical protein